MRNVSVSVLYALFDRLRCFVGLHPGGENIGINQGWKTGRFRCYDCGRTFNRKVTVVHSDYDGYDEDEDGCPNCDGAGVTEVFLDDVTTDERICAECGGNG